MSEACARVRAACADGFQIGLVLGAVTLAFTGPFTPKLGLKDPPHLLNHFSGSLNGSDANRAGIMHLRCIRVFVRCGSTKPFLVPGLHICAEPTQVHCRVRVIPVADIPDDITTWYSLPHALRFELSHSLYAVLTLAGRTSCLRRRKRTWLTLNSIMSFLVTSPVCFAVAAS